MAAVTKAAPSKYDPVVTIRVPEAVRRGLKKLAKTKGDTLTGVILESLRPFELYASEEGQEALRLLEEIVARSTSIHKAPPTYHDAEGNNANPPAEEWNGLHLPNYGSTAEPLWLHRVRQRDGQTREDAVKSYALDLWKEWGLLTSQPERKSFLASVESGSHMFVVAYVNFATWHHFPSTYEARLHREILTAEEGEPSTAAEVRFYEWGVEWLEGLWRAASKDTEPVVLKGSEAEGLTFKLTYYDDCSESENLQRWARRLVSTARRDSPGEDFETWCSRATAERYVVEWLTVGKDSK